MLIHKMAKQLTLPALILDLDAFDKNCRKIAAMANGKKIRIASKSIRSIAVLKRILNSSSVFQGIMSFSSREAVFLAENGVDDILIGYPTWDDDAHLKIAKLNKDGHKITCMVDSEEQIEKLSDLAEQAEGLIYICIDVDMSTKFGSLHFGVRRSPLKTVEDVVHLARKIKAHPRLKFNGIMGYEAQIAGVNDESPYQKVKNVAIRFMKSKSIAKIERLRKSVVEALKEEGFQLEIVNGGGTGSLHTTTKEEVVTEVTAGSGFYSPLLFDYYRDFQYKPSLYFALPVVRKPAPNIFTCLGGGYIASGPHGEDKVPKPVYPPNGKLLPFEGAGEVQTPVMFKNAELTIGNPIVFRAAKAGEICERFNEIVCVANGEVVDRYLTYRGEGKCFL